LRRPLLRHSVDRPKVRYAEMRGDSDELA